MVLGIGLALFFILLIPEQALAWGAATHLELGSKVLDNLFLLSPIVRDIVGKFPFDYLYGCINADIVIGKNLVHELQHCHNWRIGFKVLKRAKNDPQRAFAYGYLSHLAADTIAHNYFIPLKMVTTFSTRTLRHIYWEMRFDAMANKKVWRLVEQIAKEVDRENDLILKEVLKDTPLPFRTNKTIFNSLILIQRMDRWHRMIDALSSRSRWVLHEDEREGFFLISLGAILDLFHDWERATCLSNDPTGKTKIARAKILRKKLRSMKKRDMPWRGALEEAVKELCGEVWVKGLQAPKVETCKG